MNDIAFLKEPPACTEDHRREFARLVRLGFDGSDEGLEERIRDAKWLAFHYAAGDTLAAIAALKGPTERYRDDVFKQAAAPVNPSDYPFELGWVFVLPAHRRNRIAECLCERLLARVPMSGVFATTSTNNAPMKKILRAFGFTQTGAAYSRRNEELELFLRASPPH